jgi:hypothetical protein
MTLASPLVDKIVTNNHFLFPTFLPPISLTHQKLGFTRRKITQADQ